MVFCDLLSIEKMNEIWLMNVRESIISDCDVHRFVQMMNIFFLSLEQKREIIHSYTLPLIVHYFKNDICGLFLLRSKQVPVIWFKQSTYTYVNKEHFSHEIWFIIFLFYFFSLLYRISVRSIFGDSISRAHLFCIIHTGFCYCCKDEKKKLMTFNVEFIYLLKCTCMLLSSCNGKLRDGNCRKKK